MLLALLSGLVLGVFNGILCRIGGTMEALYYHFWNVNGIRLRCTVYTNGAIAYASKYKSYMVIGQGYWGVIPITVAIFLIFIAAAQLISKRPVSGD